MAYDRDPIGGAPVMSAKAMILAASTVFRDHPAPRELAEGRWRNRATILRLRRSARLGEARDD
jgi:hypothetical protein